MGYVIPRESGKRLIRDIRHAVATGRLTEPFKAGDVKAACPGWAPSTYGTFLPKHCKGNPGGETILFIRVASGRYRLA